MPTDRDCLANDPTALTEFHRPDDRFIPIRAADLVAALAEDDSRFGDARGQIDALARAISDVIEQEAGAFECALADRYADFNPDRDTIPPDDVDVRRTPQAYDALHARLEFLFRKANFIPMSDVQIDAAVRVANTHGLKVRLNPDRISALSIWVRGQGEVERRRVTWRHPLRGEARTYEVFRRLVLICRLKDDPHVVLKLFKEIPVVDVEALLPHAEIEMSWLDRLKVLGGGMGAIGSTAAKVINVIAWTRLLGLVVVGGGILAFRTITGYRTARLRRDSLRTRNLYYQNLDNNAGVVHTLVSMVAQEEFKEALLAYLFCLRPAAPIERPDDLRDQIDAYMEDRFGLTMAFDVADAISSLHRLNLLDDAMRLTVIEPHAALDRLRAHWRARRTVDHYELTTNGLAASCPVGSGKPDD
jgi:hypothetical protein